MAIKFNFGGKTIIEPGSYSRVIGGSTQVPSSTSFGKVMLIDTGKNNGWGIGSGINGELANGKNSVYEFANITDFKELMKGGLFYDLADYLFKPTPNSFGVQSVKYVRAATTVAASLTYTVAGSGYSVGTGTITTTLISTAVVGVGTKFTEELSVGDTITTILDVVIGVVLTITDDTNIVLAANAAVAVAGTGFHYQFKQTQGGTFTVKTRTEGIAANGILHNGVLIKGFAAKLQAGVQDSDKFLLIFYTGTYGGANNESPNFSIANYVPATVYAANAKVYYNGIVWKSLQAANTGNTPVSGSAFWSVTDYADNYGDQLPGTTSARALVSSPEFSTLVELTDWMNDNPTFNTYFKLSSYTINGEGKIDNVDLVANASYKLAAAGTSVYNSTDLDSVLDNITEEDNSFFLADNYDDDAKNANNTKILSFISNDADFEKIIVIGGGYDSGYLKGDSGSIGIAKYFNSSKVNVVHSGVKVPKSGGGEKELASIYHAAMYLGRTAGLEPQVPTTWKDISISSPIHELSKKDRELALMSGVIHTKFVPGKGWVINQSINTLQRNDILFLPSGDSYEVSIERIRMQLNKELVLSSRVLFVGGNLNTASAEDVKLFVEGYLYSRTAKVNVDNLIISFRDIKVELQGDAWKISYGFVPNSPINKLFFTGVMLDANIKI